eukprot:gene600-838_t
MASVYEPRRLLFRESWSSVLAGSAIALLTYQVRGVLARILTILLTTWLLAGLAASVGCTAGNGVDKGLSVAGSGIAP